MSNEHTSSVARTGFGLTVTFASGFLAEIVEFTPPAMSREVIPIPYTETPDGAIEKLVSDLVDYGEASVTIHFDPSEVPPINQPFELCTINFPSGRQWSFQGALTNYAPATPTADKSTADCTITVSGAINFDAGGSD